MSAPTARQLEVLEAIRDYTLRHKFSPSIRDLCDALDFTSTNGVNDVLKALERKGLLTRAEKTARSLVLTSAGVKWCLTKEAA